MAEPSDFRKQQEISGWLYKWVCFWRGYEKMWFVLSDGILSYYKNPTLQTCRGVISVQGATIRSNGSNRFVIANGEVFHMKAENDTEKQRWLDALTMAGENSVSFDAQSQIESNPSVTALISTFRNKLEEIKVSNTLTDEHCQNLLRALRVISSSTTSDTESIINDVNKHAAIFRASSSAMISICSEYADLIERHIDKWAMLLQPEKQSSIQSVENESSMQFSLKRSEETFYDCEAQVSTPGTSRVREDKVTLSIYPAAVVNEGEKNLDNDPEVLAAKSPPHKGARRTRIPDKQPVNSNFWSVMKSAVGKDPGKASVPVDFLEPISLLQRLNEDFVYANILDKASSIQDPGEQLAHMAGFAISAYSSTINRTGKPFNPLLGETFEWDRMEDLGWRSIAEQVSHYPPTSALYCEGKGWEYWQELSLTSKFRGTYLQVVPQGEIHVKFKSGNHYVWNRLVGNIHNILIGKLWVDHEGELVIKCHTNGFNCHVSFLKPNFWGTECHKVKGTGSNKDGQIQFHIAGGYDSKVEMTKATDEKHSKKRAISTVLWERVQPPSDSDKYYNFTLFACQLNEMEDGVAPTDSRHRPDQRYMEEGNWEVANQTKKILEEKQRARNKSRLDDPGAKPYVPFWFRKSKDQDTATDVYLYQGEYWPCKMKKDWSRCPKIFT